MLENPALPSWEGNKMAISEFLSVDFGKIFSVGGGLGALQFFGHLKRVLELFHFR